MKRPLLLAMLILFLTGCVDNSTESQLNETQPAPTAVTIERAQSHLHAPTTFFNARIQAIESASLTPRTTGFLLRKNFSDGAIVEEGDILFEIDPTTYEAAVQAAEAGLEEAEASLELIKITHDRQESLLNSGGISQANFDRSEADFKAAKSKVQAAKANLIMQSDNLENTKVKAPYSGQIGRSNFSIGDMVGPDFGPLTDIVQVTPIEASFSLNENELTQHKVRAGKGSDYSLKVDGSVLDLKGNISFIDNKVNANSGTVNVAAQFDNSSGTLIPNQFVRVGISPSQPLEGVVIPHKSVFQDKESQYVLTVSQGIATKQEVTIVARIGQEVFISEGLYEDTPVIIGGQQRIMPGSPVTFEE